MTEKHIEETILELNNFKDELNKSPDKAREFYEKVMDAVYGNEPLEEVEAESIEKTKEDLIMELTHIKVFNERLMELTDYVGIETYVGEFMSNLFTRYLKVVTNLYQDSAGKWIEYFVYECNCGDKDFARDAVTVNEKSYSMASIEDFVDFYFEEVYKK